MKCMKCNASITWDNSYGYSKETCLCHECFMNRAGNNPKNHLITLSELIAEGKRTAEQKKKSKRPPVHAIS